MKKTLLLCCLAISTMTLGQTWNTGANIPEAIRAGNTASYVANGEGYLFIVSGRNQDGIITTRHQKYNINTNVWSDLAPHPTGILGASTAIVKDSIYVIGGLTTTPGNAIRKVRKYSIKQNTWTDVANFPVNIVDSDAVAYQDSLIYVTAGYNSRVRIFNTKTNKWRDATSMTSPLESIAWGALSVKNNKLVYMCGTDDFFSPNYFKTVRIGTIDQTNRANITWTEATPFPGQTRTFFDAHSWENGIIMTGGSTNNSFETNSNECYFYNVDSDTWTQLPSKPTSWVTGNSASLFIDNQWKLICASGYNNSGYLFNTEIFSTGFLSNNDFEIKNQCNWKNFRFNKKNEPFIEFCSDGNVVLEVVIHSINGVLIKNIPNKIYKMGNNEINVQNHSLSAGLYLCTLKNEEKAITKKIFINN